MTDLSKYNLEDTFSLSIAGAHFYVDFAELETIIGIKEKRKTKDKEGNSVEGYEINAPRYEILRMMLDTLLTSNEELDEDMGSYSLKNLTIPFKLAFNTLSHYKIIKEKN